MPIKLLLIDPQNDFCDLPGAALPVPGADADMRRLARFMSTVRREIADVIITLDSHASVGIERPPFWETGDGGPVAPFTVITERDVREGKFRPRDPALQTQVLDYLRALEQGGRYQLMVWPVHCVVGTWGHNLHEAVANEVASWEAHALRPAWRVLKGQNPMTEQYSAIRAEVPSESDPATQTNERLIARVRPNGGMLFVAGEAASHCVMATMEHLFEVFSPDECRKVVLLRDCMSPVTGFEDKTEAFFAQATARGVRVLTSEEAMTLI